MQGSLFAKLLTVFYLVFGVQMVVMGQSLYFDEPTPITSQEVSGLFETLDNHYYSFQAGPGEAKILMGFTPVFTGIYGGGNIGYELYDSDLRHIEKNIIIVPNRPEQHIVQVPLLSEESLTLKIGILSSTNLKAMKYFIRLSGDVNLNEKHDVKCLPKSGSLNFQMRNGSTKSIQLEDVESISVIR